MSKISQSFLPSLPNGIPITRKYEMAMLWKPPYNRPPEIDEGTYTVGTSVILTNVQVSVTKSRKLVHTCVPGHTHYTVSFEDNVAY